MPPYHYQENDSAKRRVFCRGLSHPTKNPLWISTMKKGRQGAPVLLQGVSLRTPDTTVSLCPRMWSRDWRQWVTKCEVQKRGCMSKPKIVIATPIHSQPLIPGDTKTLNATLETPSLRSTLASAQTCPRVGRKLPTSHTLHCVTFYIFLWGTTSHRLAQLREAINRELLCIVDLHMKSSMWDSQTEKEKKMMMQLSMAGI